MLKKWKKTVKVFATTVLVLIYVTIGVFHGETLKGEEKRKRSPTYVSESAGTTETHPGTMKTILGYSEEYRIRKEMEDRLECGGRTFPREAEEGRTTGWREEKRLGLRIFSAYYDQRQEPYHYVRVIGLLGKNSSFYCQVWYKSNATITAVTQKASINRIWSNEWGPKNSTCQNEHPVIVSCLAPPQNETGGPPSWVSFVDRSCAGSGAFVRITPPGPAVPSKNFVICVKPLTFGHVNERSFLEWLNINRRLGAEKITIYVPDSTRTDLLSRNGGVTVKKFKTPKPGSCPSRNLEESIWHKRKMEIIAYNDCFYSNLYHTKFVIPLDVDEIIVPKSGNDWFEAFRSHFLNGKLSEETKNAWPEEVENYASYSVRNAYFFPRYSKDAIIRSLKLPKRDQNAQEKLVEAFLQRTNHREANIFDRTVRSYRLSPNGDSVKSFIRVANALSVFNHYAFHVLGKARRQFVFPGDVFQLNHYRNSCDPVLIDGCGDFLNEVVYDDSLERFRKKRKPSA